MRNRTLKRCAAAGLIVAGTLLAGCNSDNSAKDNLNTGYQALEARNFDEAMARADQQLAASPDGETMATALYLKGQALEQKNVSSPADGRQAMLQAHDLYSQAMEQHPGPVLTPLLHAGLANTAYFVDDYPTALQEWQTAYPGFEDQSVRSFILYRVGLCQQRLNQFAAADETFAAVQQQYPETDAARRSHDHQGYKSFTLQLATYANSMSADAAIATLHKQGVSPNKATDMLNHTVVTVGPIATYQQATDLRNRMLGAYPQTIILP